MEPKWITLFLLSFAKFEHKSFLTRRGVSRATHHFGVVQEYPIIRKVASIITFLGLTGVILKFPG